MTEYTYGYDKKVNPVQLCDEIDTGMGYKLDGTDGYINANATHVDCIFFQELTSQEEIDLGDIITAHILEDFQSVISDSIVNFGIDPSYTNATSWVVIPEYLAFPDERPNTDDFKYYAKLTAIIAVDKSGETVHAAIYDVTTSTVISDSEVTHTGDTSYTVVFGDEFEIDPTHYFVVVLKRAGDQGGANAFIRGASVKINLSKGWQL